MNTVEEIHGSNPFERWGMGIGFGVGVAAGIAAEIFLPKHFYNKRLGDCSYDLSDKDCVDLAKNNACATGLLVLAGAGMTTLLPGLTHEDFT